VPQVSARLIKSCKIEALAEFAIAVAPVTGRLGINFPGRMSPWMTAPLLNTRNPHLCRWGFFYRFFQPLSFEDLSPAQEAEAEQAAAQQEHAGGDWNAVVSDARGIKDTANGPSAAIPNGFP